MLLRYCLGLAAWTNPNKQSVILIDEARRRFS